METGLYLTIPRGQRFFFFPAHNNVYQIQSPYAAGAWRFFNSTTEGSVQSSVHVTFRTRKTTYRAFKTVFFVIKILPAHGDITISKV